MEEEEILFWLWNFVNGFAIAWNASRCKAGLTLTEVLFLSHLTNLGRGSLEHSPVTWQHFIWKMVTVTAQSVVWFSSNLIALASRPGNSYELHHRPGCVCGSHLFSCAGLFLTWKDSGLDCFVFRFCESSGYYYIRAAGAFDRVKTFPSLLSFLVCDLTGLWPVWVGTFFFFFNNNKLHFLFSSNSPSLSLFLPPPLLCFFPR